MKTIEEAAKEYSKEPFIQIGFIVGAEFAQRWIPVEEELPICYESGDWDGRRSDFVLVKTLDGGWYKAKLYSGTIDGSEFNDWVNENDNLLNVIYWRPMN